MRRVWIPMLWLAACATTPAAERKGDEIVVCGERFSTGTRVVLWSDPQGYDGYARHRHYEPDEVNPTKSRVIRRYSIRRDLSTGRLAELQRIVTQVVIHYDAAGTAGNCFRILHDVRGLSSHFLIDLDGTVYQTLDLKERAWHASSANDRSVGIEMANIGAYGDMKTLRQWYADDGSITLPKWVRRGHLPDDFVGRPARPDVVKGTIQGRELFQYDYTDAQYEALARLLATLTRVLPEISPDAPRGEDGAVLDAAMEESAVAAFRGIVGHHHITRAKVDPGPAFDWDRALAHAMSR